MTIVAVGPLITQDFIDQLNAALAAITTGGFTYPMVNLTTGNYAMAITDYGVNVNKTIGAATSITLPADAPLGQQSLVVDVKGDAGTNNISVSAAGGGTIDGVVGALVLATNYEVVRFESLGSNAWKII